MGEAVEGREAGSSTGAAGVLRLTSEAAFDAALAAFRQHDPAAFAALWTIGGRPALRHGRHGFEGLAATIMGQQVSTASAAAIFGRLSAALRPLTAETFMAASDETLRICGLSAAKVRTLRGVAEAVRDGTLKLDSLGSLPAEDAHRRLVALKGIGPWTAEVFLLFCLGEPDVFPAGDLALQEAYRLVFGGETRPSAVALLNAVEPWRPWRGVGAYMLWACYRALRGGTVTPMPSAAP